MDQSFEEFEPLFDYSRVQPNNFVYLDDEEFDPSPIAVPVKKKQKDDQAEKRDNGREKKGREKEIVVLDDDDDEDWLRPPSPKVFNARSKVEENSTIKELRLKKQELASLAQSAQDILKSVSTTTKSNIILADISDMEPRGELPSKKVDRKKIVISIQDKDGQKQFRMYMVDKATFLQYAHQREVLKQRMQVFWHHRTIEMYRDTSPEGLKQRALPLARIKRIMKFDEGVKLVSSDTPILFAKACELFIEELTLRAYQNSHDQMRFTIQKSDVATAVHNAEELTFLMRVVPLELDQDEENDLFDVSMFLKPQGPDQDEPTTENLIISEPPPPLM